MGERLQRLLDGDARVEQQEVHLVRLRAGVGDLQGRVARESGRHVEGEVDLVHLDVGRGRRRGRGITGHPQGLDEPGMSEVG